MNLTTRLLSVFFLFWYCHTSIFQHKPNYFWWKNWNDVNFIYFIWSRNCTKLEISKTYNQHKVQDWNLMAVANSWESASCDEEELLSLKDIWNYNMKCRKHIYSWNWWVFNIFVAKYIRFKLIDCFKNPLTSNFVGSEINII